MTAGSGPGTRVRADLAPRVASAILMAALAFGAAWIGGWIFDVFWLVAAYLVLWEWHALTGVARRDWSCVIGGLCLGSATAAIGRENAALLVAPLLLGAAASLALAQDGRRLLAVAGYAYAGILALGVPLIRRSTPDGFAAVIWLFAVVWGTDTMAFFGGRTFGGPKLAPRLSPSKTWSGFMIGVVSGAAIGLAVSPRSDSPLAVLAMGLFGGAIAQAGDLFESALKRRFGVKDSGSLIPGHGGVMDRLDGFVATSLFAAILGLWRFGPAAVGAGLFRW